MAAQRRNEFLDAGSEEDEDRLSQNELDAEDSRTAHLRQRGAKRQKFSHSTADGESDEEADGFLGARATLEEDEGKEKDAAEPPSEENRDPDRVKTSGPPAGQVALKMAKDTRRANEKSKPGVVYLSRIPPFMRPSTVRTLLSPFGTITQLFLTPEPPSAYAARKNHGGNKKRSFVDGWVEFKHKRHAKACVDGINGHIVGGKKGGWYRDDVWNAKYLRGFSWDDLMASVRQEEREREEKIRVGIAKDKKEREAFLKSFESAKVEKTRERKRQKKAQRRTLSGNNGGSVSAHDTAERDSGYERLFKQKHVHQAESAAANTDQVTRVLSKIF